MSGIQQWESIGDDITREHIAVKMLFLQYKANSGNRGGAFKPPTKEEMAKSAVEYADALIAELKRRKDPQQ